MKKLIIILLLSVSMVPPSLARRPKPKLPRPSITPSVSVSPSPSPTPSPTPSIEPDVRFIN